MLKKLLARMGYLKRHSTYTRYESTPKEFLLLRAAQLESSADESDYAARTAENEAEKHRDNKKEALALAEKCRTVASTL